MDRQFLLPATVAAALHVGLLFGYRPDHVAAPTRSPLVPISDFVRDVFVIDVIQPDDATEVQASRPASGEPRPTTPEPPVTPRPTDIVIDVPVTPAINPNTILSKIPLGPIGPSSDLLPVVRPGDGGLFRSGDLDNTPRTRSQVAPVYPFEAKRDGRSGTVLVEFTVNENGAVISPRVVESSDRVFEEAAVRAVAKWRFEPGRRDGRVVRFRMAVPMVFALNAD